MKRMNTILFLMLALAFILIGLLDGQFQAVLTKASRVCLECVGIG